MHLCSISCVSVLNVCRECTYQRPFSNNKFWYTRRYLHVESKRTRLAFQVGYLFNTEHKYVQYPSLHLLPWYVLMISLQFRFQALSRLLSFLQGSSGFFAAAARLTLEQPALCIYRTNHRCDFLQGISVTRFREEMDRYLACQVEGISEQSIGKLMRHLIQRHLGWITVWGCVFGVITGLATQALRLSLNFDNTNPSQ